MSTNINTAAWKAYCYWAFWVGIAFFAVYPTCNWLTANRSTTYPLYLESELAIPLVPDFFWIYISMYILFLLPPFFLHVPQLNKLGKQLISGILISAIFFLLLPAELGFVRVSPDDPFYAGIFSSLFSIDLPHNLVPSLHVIFTALIIFALLEAAKSIRLKYVLWAWLTLVCISTLLVHQHHILDIMIGLMIAVYFRNYFKGEKDNVQENNI